MTTNSERKSELVETKISPEIAEMSEEQSHRKLGVIIQQIGINMLILGLLALLAFLAWQRFSPKQTGAPVVVPTEVVQEPTAGGPVASLQEVSQSVELTPFATPVVPLLEGVFRRTNLNTIIPTRPRVDVITYEVEQGDNIFAIADQYGLEPESILWGNEKVLKDDPRLISPGQLLNILPVDGVYYEYQEGKTLRQVAEEFEVEPEAIVEWPGNHLDPYETDLDTPLLAAAGSHLIIPGGVSEITDWGPPAISRANPAVAAYYGSGACGQIYEGPIGNGTFVWPTTGDYISGYDYDPGIHPAIDIGGSEGNAIYATDSGVVVFSGWSEYGYGYMIVIDHGNGWQSAYAHLVSVGAGCGQSVYQGQVIGGLGNTGNSTGPHLHFELRSEIYGKVNPWNYLIP